MCHVTIYMYCIDYFSGTDNFTEQDRKYNLPFLFFQYENGNFADIFFLNEDNSSFIRNFKRHLAYTLVTSLNENVTNVAEETPYGNQKIYYNSESADGIAREMFGWKFQKPLSSNNILVKHWIDSKDNIEYDQENTYEFNDQHQFDFWYIQLQLFRNGKMIEAKGKCSHEFSSSLGKLQMQFIDINKDELIRDFKVQSSFVFKLRSYKKRSIPENININYLKSEFQFISSSLLPEYEAETGAELFLNTFYFKYKKEIEKKMKKLFETNFSDSYELSKLLEMINLEISLGINYEVNSITYIVKGKLNEHYVSRICLETPSTCPKLFYLYCLVGGKSAENMLISYLTGNKSIGVMRYHAINSLSELLNSSEEFIENILLLIESLEDKDIVGTLIVNLGIITRKSSTPIDIQTKVAETFLNFIETSSEKCIVTPFITDIFIGLGNL
ncbi:uncharacterized protein [Centruroides vittatus]|uniref:uncharacterized protein n=1 Tax=Centruroides vittatus TaxID=120091 RepID=UPI00350EAC52